MCDLLLQKVTYYHSVHDWMNLCRNIPFADLKKRSKLRSLNTIVQVDESLMRGKRKYNSGRLLRAGIAFENVDVVKLSEKEKSDFRSRNYGKKLTGPLGVWYVSNIRKWFY